MPKILFLDQSGKLGGAELCLLDLARFYRETCLVFLFEDGEFEKELEKTNINYQVSKITTIKVKKNSGFIKSLGSLKSLIVLAIDIAKVAKDYDIIYANTQKALVVGALASIFSRRPLVYHLHDILSLKHFSVSNQRIAVTLANNIASLVICNSKASQSAFIEAKGKEELTTVIYNGFNFQKYQINCTKTTEYKQRLGLEDKFIIGSFSRLSPWKGQHILLEALSHCPKDISVIFVGGALFGEDDYLNQLTHQLEHLGLNNQVHFLGFQTDIIPLMKMCDLIVHTSVLPEPFGRVIVEAMLCGKPVIASNAGGATELISPETTGWLVEPEDYQQLSRVIQTIKINPEQAQAVAQQARLEAQQKFNLDQINQLTSEVLANITK